MSGSPLPVCRPLLKGSMPFADLRWRLGRLRVSTGSGQTPSRQTLSRIAGSRRDAKAEFAVERAARSRNSDVHRTVEKLRSARSDRDRHRTRPMFGERSRNGPRIAPRLSRADRAGNRARKTSLWAREGRSLPMVGGHKGLRRHGQFERSAGAAGVASPWTRRANETVTVSPSVAHTRNYSSCSVVTSSSACSW